MSGKKVVLVGYSGHGFVVADAVLEQGLNLEFYTDKQQVTQNSFNLEYLGFEGDRDFSHWQKDFDYVLGIGDNIIRRKAAEILQVKGENLLTIIQTRSSVSGRAEIGTGSFIGRNAAVNAFAIVGDFSIINTGAIVEHECRLGKAVHIAPGAVLAGNVEIGDNTFVGANAVIKEGVRIGRNVIIGAGSVILKNVEDNQTIVGNPGRVI